MTSVNFGTLKPSYIIKINSTINIGTGRHLLMERPERLKTVSACYRICERIRKGNIVDVTVRKVKE